MTSFNSTSDSLSVHRDLRLVYFAGKHDVHFGRAVIPTVLPSSVGTSEEERRGDASMETINRCLWIRSLPGRERALSLTDNTWSSLESLQLTVFVYLCHNSHILKEMTVTKPNETEEK